MGTRTWNIRFITDWDEIYSPEFQSKWLFWADNAVNSHVFFHPALCMAWIDTYHPLRKLDPLFCIAENETGVLFLPLVLWRRNWKNAFQRIIIPVGYSDFDYHEPYYLGNFENSHKNKVLSFILNEVSGKYLFDVIKINGILTEATGNGWSKEEEISPFCDLVPYNSSEEYLQSLKGSLRGDVRRQNRRIEELGSLQLIELMDLNEDLKVLPSFLELHRKRWPKAYKATGFHENLLKYGLDKNIVHFTALRVNDKTMSYHLGFKFNHTYYYYMPVIDPQYENLSPGKIHLFKLIEYALNNGFLIFDHLRGDENYKSGWASQYRSLYRFSIQSRGLVSWCKNSLVSLKN